ncbi:MAG TPA: LysR substrate-binding domain-containing protein [Solirubrobacteraceae bacterium]|jgi:DNA-binding transcriptional LysR family regulator
MNLDPRLLRAFVVLADTLHFGRAAEHLHVTQPTLSQQIRRLETQLGVTLLERTSRSVALSEAGRALLGHARAAVTAADQVATVAAEYAGGTRGTLRFGFSPGTHELAQRLLARLAAARPDVRVVARQDNTGVLTDLVARGELELALGFCPQPAAGVAAEPLADERAVLAVRDDHPLARRRAVALAELERCTFALVDEAGGAGYNATVRERCRGAGFEPRTPADPHGPLAWETAVRSGGCVGLTTRSAAAATTRGVRLLRVEPPVTFPVALLRAPVLSPVAAAFAAFAHE